MQAALPLTLAALAIVFLVVLIDGLVQRRRLARNLRVVRLRVPRDPATGLLDRSVCRSRITSEVERARRTGGNVWVCVVTVVSGDPDLFGRLVSDSLRFPEVGFRLADQVVCIVRPQLDEMIREDLVGRLVAAAPRIEIAVGETLWLGPEDGDAADLLRAASRMREVPH